MSGCRMPPILSPRTAINVVEFDDNTWLVAGIDNCLEIGPLAEGKLAKRQTRERLYRIFCTGEEIEQIIVIQNHAPFKGPCIVLLAYLKYAIIDFVKLLGDSNGERAVEWKTVVDIEELCLKQDKKLEMVEIAFPTAVNWHFSAAESKLSCHGFLSIAVTNIFEPDVAEIAIKNLYAEGLEGGPMIPCISTGNGDDGSIAYYDEIKHEVVEILSTGIMEKYPKPMSSKAAEIDENDLAMSREKLYLLKGNYFYCYDRATKQMASVMLRFANPSTKSFSIPTKGIRIWRGADREGRPADFPFVVYGDRILAYQCTDGELKLQWLMDCNCGVGDIEAWDLIGNDYVIASGPGGTAKITVSNVISEGPKLLPADSMRDFLVLKSAELKEFFIVGDRMLWLYKGHLVQTRVESAFLDKPLEEAPDFPVAENGIYEKILAVNTSTNIVVLLRNDEGVAYQSFDVSVEDAPIELPPLGFLNKASVKELLDLKILPDLFLTPPNVYRPAGQSGDTKDFMETCLTLVDACIDKISFVCHAQRAPEFEPDNWEVVWGRGQVEDEMVKTAFLFIDDQEYLIGITQSGLVYGPAKGHGTWMPFTEAGAAKQSERYNFVDMQCLYEKQQILLLMQGAFVLTCGWFVKDDKLIFQQLRFDSIPDLREAKCFLSHATQRCLVFGWGHLPRYWTNDDHYSPLIYDYETKKRWSSSRHNLREMHAARELCFGVHINSDGNASMVAINGANEWFHLALERDEVVTVQPGLIAHQIEKVVAAPFDDLGFTLIAAVGEYRATLLIYQPENELLTAVNEHAGTKFCDAGFALTETINGVRVAVATLVLMGRESLGSFDVLELMIKGNVEDPSMPEVLILKRTRRCGPGQANCMYIPQTYEWWEGFFWMYYVTVVDCKRKLCTGDCGQGDYMAIGQYGIMPEAKWFSTLRRDAVAMKQVHSKEPRFQMTFKRSTQKRGSDVEVYYVEEEGDSKAKYALWNVARTKFAFGKGLPHYTYIDYDGKTISLLNQENFVTVKIRNTDSLWPRELDFGKDPCYFLHKRGEEFVWVLAKASDGTKSIPFSNFFAATGLLDDASESKICPILLNHALIYTKTSLRIARPCACFSKTERNE